jgi:NTP pyrophosphatase (non-canonical NTP hydrolase)
MDTVEDQRRSWDLVPVKRKKRIKVKDQTGIQKKRYNENEVNNMKNRLLQKTVIREVLSDISFTASYQQWAYSMWNYHNWKDKRMTIWDDYIMTVGLGGETGEVLELLKKLERNHQRNDPKLYAKFRLNLRKELGDVLYYLTMIASRHDVALDTIIKENVLKLENRLEKRKKRKLLKI